MELADFHLSLDAARGHSLNPEQREAVDHGHGPLWLIAGPGSGKTEVLVTRALKLVVVDAVAPGGVFLTTFTKKAARNLEDRMAVYMSALEGSSTELAGIDLADMRVGTLHSLCNDVLQEYRHSAYQNVRLMDDVEQSLFMYRRAAIAKHDDLAFWTFFDHCVPRWSASGGFAPGRWKRVKAATTLFNHLVEDLVDLDALVAEGGHWGTLAGFCVQYRDALAAHHRCDFAHVQQQFLDFLSTANGARFLGGDERHPPLQHVLVDEYQDTNPIQERIYLGLAAPQPHNITVVGDDDQALYRFRGGTVACMVHFDAACTSALGVDPTAVQLIRNYRSHADVVEFFNDYMDQVPEMAALGVRAPGKEPVEAHSAIGGAYPAVGWIQTPKAGDLGEAFAEFLEKHLIADGIISDLSQCVVLLRSTRDSVQNAGPFLRALEKRGIPTYNPRSKSFMDAEEVQALLAVLVNVLDPRMEYKSYWRPVRGKKHPTVEAIDSWFRRYQFLARTRDMSSVTDYVKQSLARLPILCAKSPGKPISHETNPISLLEMVYRILSLEPFRAWRTDPERNLRLSKLTRLLEGYHSLSMDLLWADASGAGLSDSVRMGFFYTLVSYLVDAGIDDDEDDEVVVPLGRVPLMTIHQSKGLEFPVVFVASLGNSGRLGAAQQLEHALAPFRKELYPRAHHSLAQLVLQDDVRLWYVAYSRAQHGLVIVATLNQLKKSVAVPGRDWKTFRSTIPIVTP